MDPITSGNIIFKNLAEKFGNKNITELSEVKKFFEYLMHETKGLVILDFLDTANWDMIESFEVDDKRGILTLTWHDYRTVDEALEDKELRQMAFPASLYSLGIAIKTITPIIGKNSAVFLVNGYAKTEKEIKSLYNLNSSEFKITGNSFFERNIIRKINKQWELIDFHCTPIYSLAIIPKNCGLNSFDSKKLLYQYNIQEALKRVAAVIESLNTTKASDHDLICEKVNTARRVLESILKIECCYKDIEVKGNYSQILLGPLLNSVKKVKENELKPILGKMAKLLNEFSHDSGKAIELNKATLACTLVVAYIKLFQCEIK